MSTLGGSRGERHAKPKFTALDINRLYKSSRGESLEPSTQKSQVPRKHGMQSLGKVPSARRPPANLPSLKAETQTPGSTTSGQEQQGGTQTSVGGTNSGQTAQVTLNSNTNSNSTSSTQIQASSPTTQSTSSYNSSNIGSSAVTWSSVTTGHDGGSSSLPPLYQSPQFHHEFPSLDGSAPGSGSHKSHHKDTHQQHYGGRDGSGGSGNMGQQKDQSDLQHVSLRPQTDAASWIQQQQQSGGGKGGDAHGTQQGQALLQAVPPQFRALMPSFMYRGSGSTTGSDQTTGGARSLTPPTQQQQQQYSGGGTGQGQSQSQQNGNYSATQGRQQRQPQPAGQGSGQKEYRTNSPNTTGYQHHNSNAPITIQKRPQQQQPSGRARSDQDSNSIPYIEPEVALLQRPIIKEEDLERMDSIAKDDGWIRQDEIDYNQKLIFSDDESPDSPGTEKGPPNYSRNEKMMDNKKSSRNQDEDNRTAWNRERDRDNKERAEREHLERERNERNERERERDHSRPTVSESSSKSDRDRDNRERERDRDRDRDNRERERENCTENSNQPSLLQRPQQNGHRGLDAGVFERVKQRKEEEDKREFDRKQAAAKKLQELEMKMNTKKSEEDFEDSKHVQNEDEYSSKGKLYRDPKDIRDSRDNRDRDIRDNRDVKDFRERDSRDSRDSRDLRDNRDGREGRDYGRYEKYERDMNQRERDYKDNYINGPPGSRGSSGGGKSLFSAHFQNNLPPRFARQQQQQERASSSGSGPSHQTGSGPISGRDSGSSSSSRSITANHQPSQHYHHGGSDLNQKPVPFAQQYDPRYIHSQNYKQQQLRRNPSDEMIQSRRNERQTDNFNVNAPNSRRRGDSEDDDRFSNSGRESTGRNSLGEQSSRPGNVTPQLARSVSDSSQRKTSVSSTDEQKQSDSIQLQSSEPPRVFGSWAEETESEFKRRRESFSSEHSIPKHDSSAEDAAPQPKQILQRPQTKSISESSAKKDDAKSDNECRKDDGNPSSSNSASLPPRQQSPVVPTQILRRSESPSPKAWSECVAEEQEKEAELEKPAESPSVHVEESSGSAESPCTKNEAPQQELIKNESEKLSEELKKEGGSLPGSKKESGEDKQETDANKSHHSQKRPSPRGGRQDMRGPPSRGYMYRGGSSWSRRGGGGGGGGMRMSGRNYSEHWTDSENSEEMEEEYGGGRRSERSPKVPRKERDNKGDSGSRGNQSISSKEGFAPRGEPSRRGRGGGGGGVSSFRRGGMSAQGPKRMDSSYGGPPSSKSNFSNSGPPTNLNEEKNDKTTDRKTEISTDDKTKLNQMALSAGLNTRKSSECMDDSSKNRDKGSQPKTSREEKKSPPKQFGGPQYQSQGSRKDSTSSSKNDAQNQGTIHTHRRDEDGGKKDVPSELERKKSVSKEKDIVHNEAPKQQRSNSSGHISSSRSAPHLKKEERPSQKPITKPPPGLGFKQNSNLGPGQQQSNQQHKEQPLTKSKSSGDTRCDSRGNSKTNLPPRLAKQWETRAKRDGNQSDSSGSSHQQQSSNNNAWEKPLPQSHEGNKVQMQDGDKDFSQQHMSHQQQSSQNSGSDQKSNAGQKSDSNSSKTVLDASSAPVNTIIFENTNYKTVQAPLKRQMSNQSDSTQGSQKKQDEIYKSQSTSSMQDIQQAQVSQQQVQQQQQPQPQREQQMQQPQTVVHQAQQHQQQAHNQQQQHQQHQQQEAITTALSQMSFAKAENDYEKDMKLGFPFDTEFSHLTEDKTSSANKPGLCLPRSSSVIHSSAASQNTISPSTADLNMKIASVKKVWESVPPMPTVLEHAGVTPTDAESHLTSNFVTSQHQQHLQHFAAAAAAAHAAHGGNIHMQHALSSPGPPSYANTFDPNLDPHFGNKDGGVNPSGNPPDTETGGYSPSPQHAVGSQGQHQNNAQSSLALKHAAEALSSSNGNVCKVKPTQQQLHQSSLGLSPPPAMQQGTTQLHQAPQPFYQPSQFGAMPTIPSPPTTVLFNNSAMPSQGGLYGPFQIEAGRSQFSQFPGHYGTAGSGPYSAYMQTPPNMPTAPAPDMYPSLTSQFRIGGAVQTPFNQSQQLNNPNTVLISSSSNSLMSASVKPSSQQIGAIGSKSNAAAVAAAAASVGQPYGQQYMNLYPPQQAPPQLQSNSYYSNSAGGQGAFFGGPTAAGATQSYGLQAAAGIFGGHGGPAPSTGPPQQQIANFSSQFINSPLLTAAAINQFRGGPTPQTTAYMKSNQGQNHLQDSMGRQLKSPLGTDVSLNLAKQVQPQQSPPHHKNYPPSWDIQNQVMQQQSQSQNPQNRSGNGHNSINTGRPGQGPQRYPAPIQRPTNYPTHQPPSQQSQSQRPVRQPHSGPGGPINKHYYGNSGGGSGRGGHSSNSVDQNKQAVEKNIDTTTTQQDIAVKEDNSND